jgi:hypothetical protein
MHRPETKIEKRVEILCNKPSQQTKSMITNAQDYLENFMLWTHFFCQWLRLALSGGPNGVGVSHLSPEEGNS